MSKHYTEYKTWFSKSLKDMSKEQLEEMLIKLELCLEHDKHETDDLITESYDTAGPFTSGELKGISSGINMAIGRLYAQLRFQEMKVAGAFDDKGDKMYKF